MAWGCRNSERAGTRAPLLDRRVVDEAGEDVRGRAGSSHRVLSAYLNAVPGAGLRIGHVIERGSPVPVTLARTPADYGAVTWPSLYGGGARRLIGYELRAPARSARSRRRRRPRQGHLPGTRPRRQRRGRPGTSTMSKEPAQRADSDCGKVRSFVLAWLVLPRDGLLAVRTGLPYGDLPDQQHVTWWAVDDLGNYYLDEQGSWNPGGNPSWGAIGFWPALDERATSIDLIPTAPAARADIRVPCATSAAA